MNNLEKKTSGIAIGFSPSGAASGRQPLKGPLYKWLRVFLNAYSVSDDQLVEIP
jgi:hypothetical protein